MMYVNAAEAEAGAQRARRRKLSDERIDASAECSHRPCRPMIIPPLNATVVIKKLEFTDPTYLLACGAECTSSTSSPSLER